MKTYFKLPILVINFKQESRSFLIIRNAKLIQVAIIDVSYARSQWRKNKRKEYNNERFTWLRAARASAMATLAMLAGILFFLQRVWSCFLERVWKSIVERRTKERHNTKQGVLGAAIEWVKSVGIGWGYLYVLCVGWSDPTLENMTVRASFWILNFEFLDLGLSLGLRMSLIGVSWSPSDFNLITLFLVNSLCSKDIHAINQFNTDAAIIKISTLKPKNIKKKL